MKAIVRVPNTILTSGAKPVTRFDKRLHQLIADMKETLLTTRNPKGVGLAAPQIGQQLCIFLTRPKETDEIRVFINPEIITKTSGASHRDNKLEGCLSIPGIWGTVHRFEQLTLRYQDESGSMHTEAFKEFLATIIQHETDHIHGILFTHRVLEQKEKLYQTTLGSDGKEILEEITLT